MKVSLTLPSTQSALSYITKFLDSSFNPLFIHMRKSLERDTEDLYLQYRHQYLYCMGFFLEADRYNRKIQTREDDFGLVAGVLDYETIIVIIKTISNGLENDRYKDVLTGMFCLKQILLTIQDLIHSHSEDDQEVAENLQSRLFYEESTLNLIPSILKSYDTQPLSYLDLCTEVATIFLKMLEKYSQSNAHMFVRARKRRRQKEPDDEMGDDAREAQVQYVRKERQFEFEKFEKRFFDEKSIDVFRSLLEHYEFLSSEQVKRIISFYHRVFVKRKHELVMFRLDLCALFNRILHDSKHVIQPRYEFQSFVKHYTKRLAAFLNEHPPLYMEMLFAKIRNESYD